MKGHGVFQITDAIALPVEASETRVTADDETYGLIASTNPIMQYIRSG